MFEFVAGVQQRIAWRGITRWVGTFCSTAASSSHPEFCPKFDDKSQRSFMLALGPHRLDVLRVVEKEHIHRELHHGQE